MFVRLVYESFRRQTRRKLLVGVAVTLGAAVSTAMIGIATGIGDKISRELRTYGANLIVTPEEDDLDVQIGSVNLKPAGSGAYLEEAALPKIKGIFWRNNIVSFAPELPVGVLVETSRDDSATGSSRAGTPFDFAQGRSAPHNLTLVGTYFAKTLKYGTQEFTTGARTAFPWWKVNGDWPADDSGDVLVGEKLAAKSATTAGQRILINGHAHRVAGILSTGGAEDDQIVAPLSLAQMLAGKPGAVRKIFVSAVTKPEDAFARRSPDSLSPADRDRWYCSPYPQSIAFQLTEAIPHSHAEQIRQVAQNEGTVLSRIKGLMLLITLAALFTSGLAVSAAMATAMFERRTEVGLMKALGAGYFTLSAIFISETVLLACIGGVVGFVAGGWMARGLGRAIFGSAIGVDPVLLPVVLGIAIAVTFAGSATAIRRAVKYDPVRALRGEA
jgi:putative ABC transport system permease protein